MTAVVTRRITGATAAGTPRNTIFTPVLTPALRRAVEQGRNRHVTSCNVEQERSKNDSLLHQLAELEAKCERTYEGGTVAAGREATKIVDRFAERTNELVRPEQARGTSENKRGAPPTVANAHTLLSRVTSLSR